MTQRTQDGDQETVEFFFDLASPYSYLAATQMAQFEEKNNIKVIWKPILLGGLFKRVANQSPFYIESANKKNYLLTDLAMWASFYDVPFHLPSHFPPNTLLAMRGALVANKLGVLPAYATAMFHAFFVEDLDISDTEIIVDIISKVGIDNQAFFNLINTAEIKKALIDATEQAAERGAFGVPTFFYADQMFFGNDRLNLVEHAIASK